MKKIIYILILCCFLGITACGTKAREEAMATITKVSCEELGISFSLNGLWNIQSEEERKGMWKTKEGQTLELTARHTETGSSIQVIYDELEVSLGETLVRMEDYVKSVKEQLVVVSDDTYSCSETVSREFLGNTYETFSVKISKLAGEQHFFIRREEDTIMTMIITLYEGDKLEDVLALAEESVK